MRYVWRKCLSVVAIAVMLAVPAVSTAAAQRSEPGTGWLGGIEEWAARAASVAVGVVEAIGGYVQALAPAPTADPADVGSESAGTDCGPNIDPNG